MKNILAQYLWIFSITLGLLTVALLLLPEKKDQLEYLQNEIEKVQEQQKVLTEKEKQLKELSTQKEWEEVDKETNK
tara:strand:+ start:109 stop:336 length:228 start_codon:yes stop_codon:yes gene_type:complete